MEVRLTENELLFLKDLAELAKLTPEQMAEAIIRNGLKEYAQRILKAIEEEEKERSKRKKNMERG